MTARNHKPLAGKKNGLTKKHYNYGRWTKGRFSEAVTVTGPAKMVFLAGIGSEHEQTGKIMYPGDFDAQCRYAYQEAEKSPRAKRRQHERCGEADYLRHRCTPSETGRRMPPGRLRQGAPASAHFPEREPTCVAGNAGRD